MTRSEKAAELRSKLFALIGEYKSLSEGIGGDEGASFEAKTQADSADCRLAQAYEGLGDLFTDALRDPKDQSFASV